MKFSLADGSRATGPLGRIVLPIVTQGKTILTNAWILPALNVDVIMGARTFDRLGALIDFDSRSITLRAISGLDPIPFLLRKTRLPRPEAEASALLPIRIAPLDRTSCPVSIPNAPKRGSSDDFGWATDTTFLLLKGVRVQMDLLQPLDGKTTITLENLTDKTIYLPAKTKIANYRPAKKRDYHLVNLLSREGIELANKLGICKDLTNLYVEEPPLDKDVEEISSCKCTSEINQICMPRSVIHSLQKLTASIPKLLTLGISDKQTKTLRLILNQTLSISEKSAWLPNPKMVTLIGTLKLILSRLSV
jgi:hypothetical protein